MRWAPGSELVTSVTFDIDESPSCVATAPRERQRGLEDARLRGTLSFPPAFSLPQFPSASPASPEHGQWAHLGRPVLVKSKLLKTETSATAHMPLLAAPPPAAAYAGSAGSAGSAEGMSGVRGAGTAEGTNSVGGGAAMAIADDEEWFCDVCDAAIREGHVRYECRECPDEFCCCSKCSQRPHAHALVANTGSKHTSMH